MSGEDDRWTRYYEAAGEEPRQTLLRALEHAGEPGFAVDLGCGAGRDTIELLRRGWRVLAIDREQEALERLLAVTGDDDRLATEIAAMEDATWPEADLVNASFSLPFCPREAFPGLWARIRGSLRPGGRFAGQLFGDRDDWAADLTVHARAELGELLDGLDVEHLEEYDEDGETATGATKHWHVYHVVARRPA
jgi:tellurite methyltransferase